MTKMQITAFLLGAAIMALTMIRDKVAARKRPQPPTALGSTLGVRNDTELMETRQEPWCAWCHVGEAIPMGLSHGICEQHANVMRHASY